MTSDAAPPTTGPAPGGAGDDAWEGDRVARWLRMAEGLERQLAPVSDVLFRAAALQPGERVIDVGCGTGPTTRRAAQEVGPTGLVAGLDISGDMLAAAASVPVGPGAAPIEWVEGDVATADVGLPEADAVISRFGIMFFAHPVHAFERLAAAAPGGRLAVAVWAHRERSALFEVPLRAALDELDRLGVEAAHPPRDGGPFSLGDEDEVRALLEAAGWTGVTWEPHGLRLLHGGGVGPREAAVASLDFGPTRFVTADLDDADREAVREAIERTLADHLDGSGQVVLGGEVIVVTARSAA
jgi:SAM-dependent methyltransferase